MELFTRIKTEESRYKLGLNDRILLLGSCFSDVMGRRMEAAGFNIIANPFGSLYNPASIANAVARMDSSSVFSEEDCVEMGAGAGLICSFEHHTSFARKDKFLFLENANKALAETRTFWKDCNKVIITLGTAFVWKHKGRIVSNCLKLPSSAFTHELLTVEEAAAALSGIIEAHPEKEFIFTVSPIRHLGDGAHSNTISKSSLHLAIDKLLSTRGKQCAYFPAYEIVNDELRDYRFYSEDMVHISTTAEQIIWERFTDSFVPNTALSTIKANEAAFRRSLHKAMH